MATIEQIKEIPHKDLLKVIDKVRARIKKHPIVEKMFKDYGVDIDELDLVPMCFSDLEVSARTDHAIIYFNYKLLADNDFEMDDHYMIHELVHYLQQTTGDRPTKGADDGVYLDNEYEVEGFQNQTEYLAETRSKDEAESYVNQVLDHHDVNNKKEREKRKRELMKLVQENK